MDPNPKSFPIVSYVLARLPSIGPKFASPATTTDIEQPPPSPPSDPSIQHTTLLASMPHLSDPKVLASMRHAISEVDQTRSVLQTLGPRPDHETVDNARVKLSDIEGKLSRQLEEIVLSPRPAEVDMQEWRAHLADKEQQFRQAAEKDKEKYKEVLQLEEMHDAYEKMLKDAEEKLVRIYEKAEIGDEEKDEVVEDVIGETYEEVTGILVEAWSKVLERIDLSNRKLRLLPEAFGKISGLRVLNLYNNQLQAIPDSISGLENLEELNVASNLLERLPDSIGLLQNLKILDASGNKLDVLPDTICGCRSLVELDVSFNSLLYLPTNMGYELSNLQKLSIKLNKIRYLPSSIGEMKYLRYLDAHFNELHGLPQTIGKLTNLEVLDLSSNFSDLTELPETFGDLINLKELDLSNNQIHKLPDTFGRLDNLIKLNLDQNPLEIPPMDVVEKGVEDVKTFMAKRWLDILLEEERKSQLEVQEETQAGWLTRSTSLLKTYVSSVSEYISPKTPRDPYLDQQL